MNQTLAVTKIEAVEEIGPGIFEVRVLLEDASTATLRMNGYTLCSLAADLRVTQVVNGAKGVHAVLAHDAIKV